MNTVTALAVSFALLVEAALAISIDFRENCGSEPGIVQQVDISPCYDGDSSSGCALDHVFFHAKDDSEQVVHPNITIQFTPAVNARIPVFIVSAYANFTTHLNRRRPRSEMPTMKKQVIAILPSSCQNEDCELIADTNYTYSVSYQGAPITNVDIMAAISTGSSRVTGGLMWSLVDAESQVVFCFTTNYVQRTKEFICDGTTEQNQNIQMCKRKWSGSVATGI